MADRVNLPTVSTHGRRWYSLESNREVEKRVSNYLARASETRVETGFYDSVDSAGLILDFRFVHDGFVQSMLIGSRSNMVD